MHAYSSHIKIWVGYKGIGGDGVAKNNISNVQGSAKLPLPYRAWIDAYYLQVKLGGWLLFSVYSFIAFYKLVIDRLVNVVVIWFHGEYTFGELGLFDYSSWRVTTNFMPFETIMRYIHYSQYFNMNLIVVNLLGNLLIFTPMGFLLPMLSKRFRRGWRILLIGFFSSLAVETVQFIFTVGSADIDDLILNTAGEGMGYIAYKLMLRLSKKKMIS